MKQAILTVGVSASGKSSWADDHVKQSGGRWVVLNSDNIRAEMVRERCGVDFTWDGWRKKLKWEKEVKKILWEKVAFYASLNYHIIIANTHLNKETLENTSFKLKELGYKVEIKMFPISYEEACRRDARRLNGVGPSVIAKQMAKYNESYKQIYVPNIAARKAVIIDVDGTVAHNVTKRSPFDWDRVSEDAVDENIKMIISGLPESVDVLVLSGRDGCCFEATEKWLIDNNVRFSSLIMRGVNDMRADDIVKEELFWTRIADRYNVLFAIDDRPKVCRMWRSIGLKVFQVGNPHIEF
jgi:predicted kinase